MKIREHLKNFIKDLPDLFLSFSIGLSFVYFLKGPPDGMVDVWTGFCIGMFVENAKRNNIKIQNLQNEVSELKKIK